MDTERGSSKNGIRDPFLPTPFSLLVKKPGFFRRRDTFTLSSILPRPPLSLYTTAIILFPGVSLFFPVSAARHTSYLDGISQTEGSKGSRPRRGRRNGRESRKEKRAQDTRYCLKSFSISDLRLTCSRQQEERVETLFHSSR